VPAIGAAKLIGTVSAPSRRLTRAFGDTGIEDRVVFHQFNFSAGMLKVLNIDTVYENSPRRVCYSAKSSGTAAAVNYHVEVPGCMNACIAEIATSPSYPQDEAKKIAATLAAVR
jgi:hypothetical protein